MSANGRSIDALLARAIARRDAVFRAAIGPWLAEQEAAARRIAAAVDVSAFRAVLAEQYMAVAAAFGQGTVRFAARRLRQGEDVEVAALVDAERARRRGRRRGAAC